MVSRRLPQMGLVANLVEYPAVAKNSARFRFQVMAKHDQDSIDQVVARLRLAHEAAQQSYRPFRAAAQPSEAELAAAVGA